MQTGEIDALIHFWKDSLAEYRLLIDPSTVYLMEQTVKSLKELKQLRESVDDVHLEVKQ